MEYTTPDALRARFGAAKIDQLLDRDLDSVPDTGTLDAAIADSAATIDSYLKTRYALPLSAEVVSSSPLGRIAGDIALHNLQGDVTTEDVRTRYEDAIKWLKDLQAGRASLGAQDEPGNRDTAWGMRSGGQKMDLEAY